MPDEQRPLTRQESIFATAYAATGDKMYAAAQAGYAQPRVGAFKALGRPAVQAAIEQEMHAQLWAEDGVPAAIRLTKQFMHDVKIAPQHRQRSIDRIIEWSGFGKNSGGQGKEPHEMTAAELADAIEGLEALKAAKATPIGPDPDVFD